MTANVEAGATPPTTSATTSANDARRAEILALAARLFMENGFHATTVRDLARAADITQPTLYYYIGSKMDALAAIHNSLIDRLLARIRELMDSDGTAEAKLREFIRIELETTEKHQTEVVAFFRDQHSLTSEHAKAVHAKRDELERLLGEIIEQGVTSGEFRALSTDSVRLALLGMINWSAIWFTPGGRHDVQTVAGDFADLILGGLRAGS